MRIFIHPGKVFASDGDVHDIGFKQLCDLYGLNPSNCTEWTELVDRFHIVMESDKHLYPKKDGNYNLYHDVDYPLLKNVDNSSVTVGKSFLRDPVIIKPKILGTHITGYWEDDIPQQRLVTGNELAARL